MRDEISRLGEIYEGRKFQPPKIIRGETSTRRIFRSPKYPTCEIIGGEINSGEFFRGEITCHEMKVSQKLNSAV